MFPTLLSTAARLAIMFPAAGPWAVVILPAVAYVLIQRELAVRLTVR